MKRSFPSFLAILLLYVVRGHSSCLDDPDYLFPTDYDEADQKCVWLKTNVKIEKYCGKHEEFNGTTIKDACPLSCNVCNEEKNTNTTSPSKSKSRKCDGKGKGSCVPSSEPSKIPSVNPTTHPSNHPSYQPSLQPSQQPSVCLDEPGWFVGGDSKFAGMNCTDINANITGWCGLIQGLDDTSYEGKSVSEACCDCGGGDHQIVFPSSSPTVQPSVSQEPSFHEFPSTIPSTQPSVCRDEPDWHFLTEILNGTQTIKINCSWLGDNDHLCEKFTDCYYNAKNVFLACCVCGGGDHFSVAPSSFPSLSPSAKPSFQPSISMNPSDTPTMLPSTSPSDYPSAIPSTTPSLSLEPSNIPSRSFGVTYDGEPCNYPQECKERPLFPTSISEGERCELRKRRVPTKLPTTSPSVPPALLLPSSRVLKSRKRKKTDTPSEIPSAAPTNLPSHTPSVSPSKRPSSSPSRFPSITPTSSPSAKPSPKPSMQPSKSPSQTPSSKPSESPSDMPSSEPSEQPTLSFEPSSSPTSVPSSKPSFNPTVSLEPSMEPTPTRTVGECVNKNCRAEDLFVSFQLPDEVNNDVTATYVGSYGNGEFDGTYDQDFTGGVVVGPNTTITMFGNAWKAYKLEESYTVTPNSRLEFDFWMFSEAEGHAICVDSDINEDTFCGEKVRCFMLGGTQFNEWENVVKRDVNPTTPDDLCKSEKKITVDLRDLFLGQEIKINYIAFIQDNDARPDFGESAFENIKFFEVEPSNLQQLSGDWVLEPERNCCTPPPFQGGLTAHNLQTRFSGFWSTKMVIARYEGNSIKASICADECASFGCLVLDACPFCDNPEYVCPVQKHLNYLNDNDE